MVDIPEHLLQRSKERRKALGLPVPGEEGGEAEAPAADAPAADAPAVEAAAAAEAPAAAAAAPAEDVTTESGTKIPAHLLERAKRRKAAAAAAAATSPPPAAASRPRPTAARSRRPPPPAPAVTRSGCSRWSSRGRSSRPAPRRRTRCTPGRTCS